MSVTYGDLLTSLEQALGSVGVSLVLTQDAAPRHSVKAGAGAGGKVRAMLVSLDLAQMGRDAGRGDALTGGSLVYRMLPSRATDDVSLESLAALHELGHRAAFALDGMDGVRVQNISTSSTPSYVDVRLEIGFGHLVQSDLTHADLAGRT